MGEELHMWSYWKDERDAVTALEDGYPELLSKDPILQVCVAQIKAAELAINARMDQLEAEQGNCDEH